jgi:hypothetical protein
MFTAENWIKLLKKIKNIIFINETQNLTWGHDLLFRYFVVWAFQETYFHFPENNSFLVYFEPFFQQSLVQTQKEYKNSHNCEDDFILRCDIT